MLHNLFIPKTNNIRWVYKTLILSGDLLITVILCGACLLSWLFFDTSISGFQYIQTAIINPVFETSGLAFTFGLDGLSVCLILLTVFIFPLCIFSARKQTFYTPLFAMCLISIEILLLITFSSTNILIFYMAFECILIRMFLIICLCGSRARRLKAAYYFFLYTFFGSVFMLFGIYYIYLSTNSLNFLIILDFPWTTTQQVILWISFFIAFAVKIPIFPFHIWLPEAHVEAPTVGSVILASLLLKLGGYGFIRFTVPMFPQATEFFRPLIFISSLISIVYASLTTIRQIDLKRIIAYSSVAHMNVIVLGLFSNTQQGIDGSIYLMLAHGITSAGLFFCVGILYDRFHTRLIAYYGGLIVVMPVFSAVFLIFTLANMGFPGTCNFLGEILILYGIIQQNTIITLITASGIILSAIYSIWLYNRLIFGTLKTTTINKWIRTDIMFYELKILIPLIYMLIFLGIGSSLITLLSNTQHLIYILQNVLWYYYL